MILNYLDFHMEDIDMATSMVIGTQWGDEGKGKIVDWIAERADVVVRSQGGNCLLYTSRCAVRGVPYDLKLP